MRCIFTLKFCTVFLCLKVPQANWTSVALKVILDLLVAVFKQNYVFHLAQIWKWLYFYPLSLFSGWSRSSVLAAVVNKCSNNHKYRNYHWNRQNDKSDVNKVKSSHILPLVTRELSLACEQENSVERPSCEGCPFKKPSVISNSLVEVKSPANSKN